MTNSDTVAWADPEEKDVAASSLFVATLDHDSDSDSGAADNTGVGKLSASEDDCKSTRSSDASSPFDDKADYLDVKGDGKWCR